jgi:hypothetical protein
MALCFLIFYLTCKEKQLSFFVIIYLYLNISTYISYYILFFSDSKWFKQITSSESGGNWVVRFNNQKKLHKLITRYFEDVVGQDPELLPTVNLTAIAKDADLHELLLMCQLVIAIAVQSDNNKTYIEMIQSLTQKSQHALMVSIEEVMNHFNTEPDYASNTNPRLSYLSGGSGGSVIVTSTKLEDMPYRYQLEFEKILLEKKQFENSHSQLLGEYDELRERFVRFISHSMFTSC